MKSRILLGLLSLLSSYAFAQAPTSEKPFSSVQLGSCQISLGKFQYLEIQYSDYSVRVPILSKSGLKIRPSRKSLSQEILDSTAHQNLTKVWSMSRFDELSLAVKIGSIRDQKKFDETDVPNVENLPLKFPGTDIRIPQEYASLESLIRQVFDTRYSMDPVTYEDLYAYVSIARGTVQPSSSQRRPGLHVDGLQGDERPVKEIGEISFIASNRLPTVFARQIFRVQHVNLSTTYLFDEFTKQLDPKTEVAGNPYDIYMADAFAVHRSQIATEPTERTFIRITFSKAIFDRVGNGENPMFDEQIPKVSRPDRQRLLKQKQSANP